MGWAGLDSCIRDCRERILDANNSENAEMEQEDGTWSDQQARADMDFIAELVNAYRAAALAAKPAEKGRS